MFSPIKKFIISKIHIGKRLDKFLIEELNEKSRSSLQNSITKGEILVNNNVVKTGYKLKENDNITINIILDAPENIHPENIKLNIIYEDDSLIVINKPAGIYILKISNSTNQETIIRLIKE